MINSLNPGNFDDELLISFDSYTEVLGSCTTTLHDEHYVFGGWNHHNQVKNSFSISRFYSGIKISKIIGCRLTKIGNLAFDFMNGGCNTFDTRDK